MKEFFYQSCGRGKIHVCRWEPVDKPVAVVQIVHGIAEHAKRYAPFAEFLCDRGFLVVAEDHMGHGESAEQGSVRGYFHGGWFCAVKDCYHLLTRTREEFPDTPYILFGHSMGSFLVRTMLQDYPDAGISGCVICGTGWMPATVLRAGKLICNIVCTFGNEQKPSPKLQNIVFGGYNKKIEEPQTPFDWLSRDRANVSAYIADPQCGFVASGGLLRDMLTGIVYIQEKRNLIKMSKQLPVLFIAGDADPVGSYGKGVAKAAAVFEKIGMQNCRCKLYPDCRHEILNECNSLQVFEDVWLWCTEQITH